MRRHDGIVIISDTITGGKYFAHNGLLSAIRRHGMCQIGTHNLSIDHRTPFRPLLGQAVRCSGAAFALGMLPENLVRQRLYVLRAGAIGS